MEKLGSKKLVILGGGFAGVWAAMAAATQREQHRNSDIEITLISNQPDLCIKPRLHEKPDASMLVPLLPLLNEIGVKLIIDVVEGLGSDNVVICSKHKIPYNKLIFALGSQISPAVINGAEKNTFNIDSYQASEKLEQHLMKLMSTAIVEISLAVIGSGFTGIELITKLGQRFPQEISLTLIERSDKVASSLGQSMQPSILAALKQANVNVLTNHEIEYIGKNSVVFTNGQTLKADAIVLTTGPKAHALTSAITTSLDDNDRVCVDVNLRSEDNRDIFIAGDCAKARVDDEHYSLMSCQHAIPMGLTAGINAVNALMGLPLSEYSKPLYATCLDLGESGALYSQGWQRHIVKSGDEGAEMKKKITQEWIYPPMPSIGKSEIFNYIQAQLNK